MEDNIFDMLVKLKIYLPFIDYLLKLDPVKYKKFRDIQRWIKSNNRYPLPVLEKIERSITTQYRNLFLENDLKLPKEIIQIFNSNKNIKYVNIDLCSDNEDDVEIVTVIEAPAKDERIIENKIKIQKNEEENPCDQKMLKTFEIIDRMSFNKDQCDIEDLQHSSDENIIDIVLNEKSAHKSAEESIFQRRPNIENVKHKKNKKKRKKDKHEKRDKHEKHKRKKKSRKISMTSITETISLDSSEDDTRLSDGNRDEILPVQTLKTSELELKSQNNDNMDLSEKKPLSEILENAIHNNNNNINFADLAALSFEELLCFNKSNSKETEPSVLESASCNKETSATTLTPATSPPINNPSPPMPSPLLPTPPSNINAQRTNRSFNIHNTLSNGSSMPAYVNTQTNHLATQQYFPLPQQPVHPSTYSQPIPLPTPPPGIKYAPYAHKINYNDPRIKKHLKMIKNSPLFSNNTQALTANFSDIRPSNTQHPPQPTPSQEPTTYGVYKRQKEEREQKARRAEQCQHEKPNNVLNTEKQKASPEKPKKCVPNTLDNTTNEVKTQQKTVNVQKEHIESIAQTETPKENNENVQKQPAANIDSEQEANKTLKKTTRALKELECTVKGYDRMQDFLPKAIGGKRRSSVNARTAILEQLDDSSEDSDSTIDMPKRRKTIDEEPPKEVSGIKLKIQRRKTLDDRSQVEVPARSNKWNVVENSPTDIVDSRKKNGPKRRSTIDENQQLNGLNSASSNTLETHQPKIFESPKKTVTSKANNNKQKVEAPIKPDSAKSLDKYKHVLDNQPIVLLRRLPQSPTKTTDTFSKESETLPNSLLEESISSKSCQEHLLVVDKTKNTQPQPDSPQPRKQKQLPSIKYLNVDRNMTLRSTCMCVLCKAKSNDLTNHYVRNHKTESYVSRLTQQELNNLELNFPHAVEIPYFRSSNNARTPFRPRYKVRCTFCDKQLIDNFINFYAHYASHTGEFAYQCSSCKINKPFRADIESHQQRSKLCGNSRVTYLYQYPPQVMVIYLHCCNICNFVQLNEANVYKHLRDQHGKRQDDSTFVKKYILAAIFDNEGIVVGNEPLVEESSPLEGETEAEPEEMLKHLFNGEETKKNLLGDPQLNPTTESWSSSNQAMEKIPDSMERPPMVCINTTTELSSSPFNSTHIHRPMILMGEEVDIKPNKEELKKYLQSDSVKASEEITAVQTPTDMINTGLTSWNRAADLKETQKFSDEHFSQQIPETTNTLKLLKEITPVQTPTDMMNTGLASSGRAADLEETQKLSDEHISQQMPETTNPFESLTASDALAENDVKPNIDELIEYSYEIVRPLLLKLTRDTGLPPDQLYRCPVESCGGFFSIYSLWQRHMTRRHNCLMAACPHCMKVPLEQFESHFLKHRCHLYVCFHCGETAANEDKVRAHATQMHAEYACVRIEKIAFNVNYSFYVLIAQQLYPEPLKFLAQLHHMLKERFVVLADLQSKQQLTKWTVPLQKAAWLDDFPALISKSSKKCFVRECSFISRSDLELFEHLHDLHPTSINNFSYKCCMCTHSKTLYRSWDTIIAHIKLHSCSIYICCVCSFCHFDRRTLSQHIQQAHDARDVPVVNLIRAPEKSLHVAVAIVFAAGRKTFSTLLKCFCCTHTCPNSEMYALHLKQAHALKLRYACELCDEALPQLQHADRHHMEKHAATPAAQHKIRCELATEMQLSVMSIRPSFDVHIGALGANDEESDWTTNTDMETEVATETATVNGDKALLSPIFVKKESTDELFLLEEDDLVALEAQALEQKRVPIATSSAPTAEAPTIKIKNISSLVAPSCTSNASSTCSSNSIGPAVVTTMSVERLMAMKRAAPRTSSNVRSSFGYIENSDIGGTTTATPSSSTLIGNRILQQNPHPNLANALLLDSNRDLPRSIPVTFNCTPSLQSITGAPPLPHPQTGSFLRPLTTLPPNANTIEQRNQMQMQNLANKHIPRPLSSLPTRHMEGMSTQSSSTVGQIPTTESLPSVNGDSHNHSSPLRCLLANNNNNNNNIDLLHQCRGPVVSQLPIRNLSHTQYCSNSNNNNNSNELFHQPQRPLVNQVPTTVIPSTGSLHLENCSNSNNNNNSNEFFYQPLRPIVSQVPTTVIPSTGSSHMQYYSNTRSSNNEFFHRPHSLVASQVQTHPQYYLNSNNNNTGHTFFHQGHSSVGHQIPRESMLTTSIPSRDPPQSQYYSNNNNNTIINGFIHQSYNEGFLESPHNPAANSFNVLNNGFPTATNFP